MVVAISHTISSTIGFISSARKINTPQSKSSSSAQAAATVQKVVTAPHKRRSRTAFSRLSIACRPACSLVRSGTDAGVRGGFFTSGLPGAQWRRRPVGLPYDWQQPNRQIYSLPRVRGACGSPAACAPLSLRLLALASLEALDESAQSNEMPSLTLSASIALNTSSSGRTARIFVLGVML